MTLNSTLSTQQLELAKPTSLDYLSPQNQNPDSIGQKCIEKLLGPPKRLNDKMRLGKESELIVYNLLTKAGYDVRIEAPCDYDLTVHHLHHIDRIQIKTMRLDGYAQLGKTSKRSAGNLHTKYHSLAFDYLAAVDRTDGSVYLIPAGLCVDPDNPTELKGAVKVPRFTQYKIK